MSSSTLEETFKVPKLSIWSSLCDWTDVEKSSYFDEDSYRRLFKMPIRDLFIQLTGKGKKYKNIGRSISSLYELVSDDACTNIDIILFLLNETKYETGSDIVMMYTRSDSATINKSLREMSYYVIDNDFDKYYKDKENDYYAQLSNDFNFAKHALFENQLSKIRRKSKKEIESLIQSHLPKYIEDRKNNREITLRNMIYYYILKCCIFNKKEYREELENILEDFIEIIPKEEQDEVIESESFLPHFEYEMLGLSLLILSDVVIKYKSKFLSLYDLTKKFNHHNKPYIYSGTSLLAVKQLLKDGYTEFSDIKSTSVCPNIALHFAAGKKNIDIWNGENIFISCQKQKLGCSLRKSTTRENLYYADMKNNDRFYVLEIEVTNEDLPYIPSYFVAPFRGEEEITITPSLQPFKKHNIRLSLKNKSKKFEKRYQLIKNVVVDGVSVDIVVMFYAIPVVLSLNENRSVSNLASNVLVSLFNYTKKMDVLFYNISWEAQTLSTSIGTAADIGRFCKEKSRQLGEENICNQHVANVITDKKYTLIGLVEASNINSISKYIRKNDNCFFDRMGIVSRQVGKESIVSFYNKNLGIPKIKLFNLKDFGFSYDDRPCLVLIFPRKNLIFINIHMPQNSSVSYLKTIIAELYKNNKLKSYRIIVAGDFNMEINESSFLISNDKKLYRPSGILGTCCWKYGNDELSMYYPQNFDHIFDTDPIAKESKLSIATGLKHPSSDHSPISVSLPSV